MKKNWKELHELLKDHEHIFLDDEFIDTKNIEEEIGYMREYFINSDTMTIPISSVKPIEKPIFTFDDLGEKLEAHSYDTENAQGTDLLETNEEKLKEMNKIFNELVMEIYQEKEVLFYIVLNKNDNNSFGIVEKESC